VVTEGDQFAIRLTPKCGCSGKSRPEGRITSIHGAPARLRAWTAILPEDGGDGAAASPGKIVGCGSSTWPLARSILIASKKAEPSGLTLKLKSSLPSKPISRCRQRLESAGNQSRGRGVAQLQLWSEVPSVVGQESVFVSLFNSRRVAVVAKALVCPPVAQRIFVTLCSIKPGAL